MTNLSHTRDGVFISGPGTIPPDAAPPEFVCGAGDLGYFAIEVATDARLFDRGQHGGDRGPDNFFATWQNGNGLLTGDSYALPQPVWSRLARGRRLYYRLVASATPSEWSCVDATTPDSCAAAAPFIAIDETHKSMPLAARMPHIQGPSRARRTAGPITFATSAGEHRYYAIEVATDARLLDDTRAGERHAGNFYATWQDDNMLIGTRYTLPTEVWDRLKPAHRLYYRLLSSASADEWVCAAATTSDGSALLAPFVELDE